MEDKDRKYSDQADTVIQAKDDKQLCKGQSSKYCEKQSNLEYSLKRELTEFADELAAEMRKSKI